MVETISKHAEAVDLVGSLRAENLLYAQSGDLALARAGRTIGTLADILLAMLHMVAPDGFNRAAANLPELPVTGDPDRPAA